MHLTATITSDYKNTPNLTTTEIQSRPSPSSPLASLTLARREQALVEICQEIAQSFQAPKQDHQSDLSLIAPSIQQPESKLNGDEIAQGNAKLSHSQVWFKAVLDATNRVFTPLNAKITSPVNVQSGNGPSATEVDFVVEFQTNIHLFRIVIKTMFHSAPLSAMDVETFLAKFNVQGGIMADKVILVSHAFDELAMIRAKELGIELFLLRSFEHKVARLLIEIGATQLQTDDNFWREYSLSGQQICVTAFIEGIKAIGIKPKWLKRHGDTSFELLTTDGPYFYDYAAEVADSTGVHIGMSHRRSMDSIKDFD